MVVTWFMDHVIAAAERFMLSVCHGDGCGSDGGRVVVILWAAGMGKSMIAAVLLRHMAAAVDEEGRQVVVSSHCYAPLYSDGPA